MSNMDKVQKKLKGIRERQDLVLKPTKFLKETFTDFDGTEKPLNIRYYQVQGIFHLLLMKRFILGDDTGLGKCTSFLTWVLTDRGLLQLKDLAPVNIELKPDTFYPLSQPTQVWTGTKWASIKKFYNCGVKPTKTITTRRGYETTGSLVHPLKVRKSDGTFEFIQTRNLQEGDFICIDRSLSKFPEIKPTLPVPERDKSISKDQYIPRHIFQSTRESVAAFLRAFFDCEGSVTKGIIEVSSASIQMLKEIQILLLRFGVISSRGPKKLTIFGDDTRIFGEEIGFITPKNRVDVSYTESLCENNFFYDPIVNIKDGEEAVADIEVSDPEHCFVADGFVNHNTLESIGALCYLWAKKPSQKVIILTTKSATKQWAQEFQKFTQGITTVICKGSPKVRAKAREAFAKATGPTVLIMGYRSAVQDFTHLQHFKDYVLIADECFQYHTPITLADGTQELVGKIVCQKQPVSVMSKNLNTSEIEEKKVTRWIRTKMNSKKLLHLTFRFGGKTRVTKTHKYYKLNDKECVASALKKDSPVQYLCNNYPTDDQMQIVLGGLLGDASISHPNRNLWGVCFIQSEKQSAYLNWKKEVLGSLGVSGITSCQSGYKETSILNRFQLKGNAGITSLLVQSRIRQRNKKHVTFDWLDKVGVLGLAVWYGDDGSLTTYLCKNDTFTYSISLHTQGFTFEEQELIVGWLNWKWGLQAQIKISKERSDRKTGSKKCLAHIYLPDKEARKFLALMPYKLPGVEYKFPDYLQLQYPHSLDVTPKNKLITDWVLYKSIWNPPSSDKDQYVYNLEVEDNHNYFAGGVLVSNCTAFKNPKTQVHQVCQHLAEQADKVWGLTATLIKNNLMEGHGIYKVVVPGLFQMSTSQFMQHYCITRMQKIPKSNRQVPVIVGYTKSRVLEFKNTIAPYFLGRPKYEVASELPSLTIQNISVEMTHEQDDKYKEALEGLLEIGTENGLIDKETTKLTALIYCQEIVNDLELIGATDCLSPKLETLIDILSNGDFAEENVIIFTRFRTMVDIIMPRLAKAKIPAVRITGSEDEDQREAAKAAFQDPNSDVRVACITMAGSDAINLQAAKALICYDTPWSAGDFIQLVGRMIRIGSVHDTCYALHLVASSHMHGATIDKRVMGVLGKKMNLIETVLGKRFKGENDVSVIEVSNDISDIFSGLLSDARGG